MQQRVTTEDAELSAPTFRQVPGTGVFIADVGGYRCRICRHRDQAGRTWATASVMQQTPLGWRRVVPEVEFPEQAEAERYALETAAKLPAPPAMHGRPFRSGGFGLTRASIIDRNKTAMLDAPLPQADRTEEDHPHVSLSDDELMRAARAAVGAAECAVFGSMAELVHEIIARDLWKKLHYPSFGAFALSSTGLAINSDQKLLLLRTCLDVHGRDLKHWAEICVQIDALVRCRARKEGQKISSLRKTSHSLRTLARDRATGGIRWLPSYQRGPATLDGDLVRMHRTQPEIYERVVAGEVSLAEVRRQSRPPPAEVSSPFTRLRRLIESQVQFLTPPQKATLREMLA